MEALQAEALRVVEDHRAVEDHRVAALRVEALLVAVRATNTFRTRAKHIPTTAAKAVAAQRLDLRTKVLLVAQALTEASLNLKALVEAMAADNRADRPKLSSRASTEQPRHVPNTLCSSEASLKSFEGKL